MRNLAIICCLILTVAGSPANADGGLTIIKPLGGEIFRAGDSMVIQWQLDDTAYVSDALVIEISPDNGLSYARIIDRVMAASAEFAARRCTWIVADSVWHTGKDKWIHLVSDNCALYIHGYSNLQIRDQSTEPFRIVSSIVVRSPVVVEANDLNRTARARLRIAGVAPFGSVDGRSEVFLIDGRAPATVISGDGAIRANGVPGMMLLERARTPIR